MAERSHSRGHEALVASDRTVEEADECQVIEIHVFSFFRPVLSGHTNARAAAPKARSVFSGGTAKILRRGLAKGVSRESWWGSRNPQGGASRSRGPQSAGRSYKRLARTFVNARIGRLGMLLTEREVEAG